MTPILLIEIVTALVAAACLVALCAGLLHRARRSPQGHRTVGMALLLASAVHGAAATAYASGDHVLAYWFGWFSLAAFAACGACATSAIRTRWPGMARWHLPLFIVGTTLFLAHAVCGHM